MQEKTKKLGWGTIISLTILSIIFEVVGLIPLTEYVLGPLLWIIVSITFWTQGWGFFNGRKLAVTAMSLVSSLIPILQSLPINLTGPLIAMFIMMKMEEKTGISLKSLKEGKFRRPIKLPPANQEGRREPVRE